MFYVGSPDLFQNEIGVSLEVAADQLMRLQSDGKTVVLVGDARTAWGMIAIRDNLRENARKAIAELHAAGVEKVVMLTGDNERTARAIAKEAGSAEKSDAVNVALPPRLAPRAPRPAPTGRRPSPPPLSSRQRGTGGASGPRDSRPSVRRGAARGSAPPESQL